MPSAQGFLQGLYPPLGTTDLGVQQLRNGSEVRAPLDGYQLIPIDTVSTGTASETSAWLQGAGNCRNAIDSSDAYFDSAEYEELADSTGDFYSSLAPVVNATFDEDYLTYKNAYASALPFSSHVARQFPSGHHSKFSLLLIPFPSFPIRCS